MAAPRTLEVADDIRSRLGAPTIDALTRRFSPAGRCAVCGEMFAHAPLSLRAYPDFGGCVDLVAFHAGCAVTAWVEDEPAPPRRDPTWQAAFVGFPLSLPRRDVRRRPWPWRTRASTITVPMVVVRPALETARLRVIDRAEAVNADLEGFYRLGFRDPEALRIADADRVGVVRAFGDACTGRVVVCGGRQWWSAPVGSTTMLSLLRARGGAVVAIDCEEDPTELSLAPRRLADAIAGGRVLAGWAPLRPERP